MLTKSDLAVVKKMIQEELERTRKTLRKEIRAEMHREFQGLRNKMALLEKKADTQEKQTHYVLQALKQIQIDIDETQWYLAILRKVYSHKRLSQD